MLAAGAVVIALLMVVGFLLWRAMEGPLYTPGMVRSGKNQRGSLDPPSQTSEGSYWQVEEDIRLFWNEQGSGRPVLVVHGGPGYPIHAPLAGMQPLTSDLRFVYYDQRGCGKSTRPFDRFESRDFYSNMTALERTLGIGAQVADIERIRRILGQKKLILLGHSFGAFLATMYAVEFPDNVEALVLIAPADVLVLPGTRRGFYDEIRERVPTEMRAEYDLFLKQYFDFGSIFKKSEAELAAMNRRVGEFFLVASGRASEISDHELPSDNGGWMVQAMYFSMGKRHDYREALRSVHAPALIVHSENDILSEHGSRMYADYLPNSRLQIIKSSPTRGGHFLFSEEPELFASAIRAFLLDKANSTK
jgi:proline iminopeptidase